MIAGGKETKDTRPVGKTGLIALAEPEAKEKAFGPQRAKGMIEKSSTWNICIIAGGKGTKGTRLVSKTGLIALAEPEGKEKAFGPL